MGKLSPDAIIQGAPSLTDRKKSFLKEDEVLSHFKNASTHWQMQITFRAAAKRSVEGSWLYGIVIMATFLFLTNPSTCMILYQGSCLLQHFLELVSTS